MALTALQLQQREGRVTASFMPALMAGDAAKVLNEWRRLVGDPDYAPEDLSDSWPVNFGSYIEPFALDWLERKSGQALSRRGEVVFHPQRPFVCATLDSYRAADATVIDCKAPGQWRKLDDVLTAYVAQMACQRACVGAEKASLLVVHGGSEPVEYPIEIPADYEAVLWERVDAFWHCVENLIPPVALPAIAAPVPPEKWRTVDLDAADGLPNWADEMRREITLWRATAAYAKTNARATKAVKDLLPDDVGLVACAGVKVSRAKNSAISVREV